MNQKRNTCVISIFTAMMFINYLSVYLAYEYIFKMICIIAFSVVFIVLIEDKAKWKFLFPIVIIIILSTNINEQIFTILIISILFVIHDSVKFRYLIIEGLVYITFMILYDCLGFMFHLTNRISYFLTVLFNFGTPLGESVSALLEVLILMMCNIVIICRTKLKEEKHRVFKITALFLVIYVCYINLVTILLVNVPKVGNNMLFGVGIIMIIYNCKVQSIYNGITVDLNENVRKAVGRKAAISIAIICFGSVIGLGLITILSDERENRVTIVNSGTLVDVQEISNKLEKDELGYGVRDNIFSALPGFLEMNEYEVNIVQDIDDIEWNNTDNIIFVNYNKKVRDDVKAVIEKFTMDGGTIYVFTDHTNMDGIMDAANSIMSFTDLRIKNDISDPFLHTYGNDWTNGLDFFNSYSTFNICNNNEIQVWGGASIENNMFIEPIIIGKYGFSDNRDKYNDGLGGFLGNRIFDRKELGGNTILAAKQKIGKGEVYAFGDASYIQTPALFFNSKFLSRVFYESMDEQVIDLNCVKVSSAIILVGMVLFSLRSRKNRKFCLIGIGLGLIASSIVNISISKINDLKIMNQQSDHRTAVDYSLAENYDVEMLTEKSIAGGMFNIYKNIQYPIITQEWKETLHSKNMFIVAPQKKLKKSQIESMKKYIENGNNIIIIAGWEHYQNVRGFVNKYGIFLDNTELGPVPYNNVSINQIDYKNPEFKEAYPILIDNGNTKILHSFENYNLVTMTKVEDGGKIIYISDSRFLSGDNIEKESEGKIYNIEFLKKILSELV